jgi:hypothetical protein
MILKPPVSKMKIFMPIQELIHWPTEQKIDAIADSQTARLKQLRNFDAVSQVVKSTTWIDL